MKPNHNLIIKWVMLSLLALVATLAMSQGNEKVPPIFHSKIGNKTQSSDSEIKLLVSGRKVNYPGCDKLSQDTDIWSPKSVHFHPNGKKYYINSLEGCITIAYDATSNKKLKVIKHFFNAKNAHLFASPSGLFPFTHYKKNLNTFVGRPVESTFSHGGRYLWIPYYRRSYDLNAQDPSAIAIIDTQVDSIIKVMETGPLPKMVATSHKGNYLAVTHWGNNTVGIIDISSDNPAQWHYVKCIVVDKYQHTSLPGVYAIGDVVGGYQLAHAAYAEGEAALADMLGEDKPYGTQPVPVCTYTIPCFASVGLTTESAKDAGYEPVMGSFDYSANGMALAEGASGSVFVIADKATTRTLGVTIVGENSSEMIAMATSAVADGLTAEQWEKMIVAHPSLCEMVREAALDAFGKSVHK